MTILYVTDIVFHIWYNASHNDVYTCVYLDVMFIIMHVHQDLINVNWTYRYRCYITI